MMDVGWGEILLLAVVALLIFGPNKLPKAAADAGRMVRKMREMAQSAQKEISDHGIDVQGIKNDLKGVTDLHPKRIMSNVMADANPMTPAPAIPAKTTTAPAATTGAESTVPTATTAPPADTHAKSPRLDPDAT